MNQKQRTYIAKELEHICGQKLIALDHEFIEKRPNIMSILEGIKQGDITARRGRQGNQLNYNIFNCIPNATVIEFVKKDMATIKRRNIVITVEQYVHAIKEGFYVYDMNHIEKATNRNNAIANATNAFVSNMGDDLDVPPEFETHSNYDIPEYVERKEKIQAEKKKLEREVMLGNDAKIIEMLSDFENAQF